MYDISRIYVLGPFLLQCKSRGNVARLYILRGET